MRQPEAMVGGDGSCEACGAFLGAGEGRRCGTCRENARLNFAAKVEQAGEFLLRFFGLAAKKLRESERGERRV